MRSSDGVGSDSRPPAAGPRVLSDLRKSLPDDLLSAVAAHAALRRLGEPEDVGDVAVWLSMDEAWYVTGQSILVDGGFNIAGAR